MELTFPTKGLNVGAPASKQPQGTSRDLSNVRLFYNGKATGGQRPGLKKRFSQQVGGAAKPIVAMCSVTVVD
ncbi:MAG: hypothetical protein GWN67_20495 [Phycisphaerae bacterium]|nr:hypothetical protein [Fodinibius sp.]NIU58675.1 hypothetical protein [Phycisphaerae bacterium]NIV16164.1 hypothetical protein [Fodinibius sp.]NIW94961.1 hypothetical protein [Phycisphaerae bacterium]NIY30145.1 hypothetical protein [Fodinibius sp.]